MAAVNLETVVIILLLIGAFVIAYKILKMLLETAFVSFVSSVFYVALAVVFGYQLSIDRILSFAFMGATLYMFYSVIASTLTGLSKIFSGIKAIFSPVVSALVPNKSKQEKRIQKLENKLADYSKKVKELNKKDSSSNTEDPEEDSVKEVILGNKDED